MALRVVLPDRPAAREAARVRPRHCLCHALRHAHPQRLPTIALALTPAALICRSGYRACAIRGSIRSSARGTWLRRRAADCSVSPALLCQITPHWDSWHLPADPRLSHGARRWNGRPAIARRRTTHGQTSRFGSRGHCWFRTEVRTSCPWRPSPNIRSAVAQWSTTGGRSYTSAGGGTALPRGGADTHQDSIIHQSPLTHTAHRAAALLPRPLLRACPQPAPQPSRRGPLSSADGISGRLGPGDAQRTASEPAAEL